MSPELVRALRVESRLALVIDLAAPARAVAQEKPASSDPAAGAASGISAAQMAKANNPLADMNALNLQNFWAPSLRGLPDDYSNTLNVRPVMVAGRQIIRATIPLPTVPLGGGAYASGLGDINVFDAIKLTGEGAHTDFAVGPLVVFPSSTDHALGQSKWQAGGAVVAIHPHGRRQPAGRPRHVSDGLRG